MSSNASTCALRPIILRLKLKNGYLASSRTLDVPMARSYHAVASCVASFSRFSFCSKDDRSKKLLSKLLISQTSAESMLHCKRYFSARGKRDFYEILEVDRSADKATIKKAYFKLAKQFHPDTNQGDEKAAEKFKEATEAYEVLSDEKQRELYNQFGHAGVDPNFQASGGNPFEGFEGFDFKDGSFHFSSSGGPGGQEIDAEDLFDMFFGAGDPSRRGRRRNRGPRRGADLQMHVRLSFMEAVRGAEKELNLRYQHVDRETGNVSIKEKDVNVTIPAGIENGMNLRLQGKGAEGDKGAPPGNLLVQVIVDSDPYFQRDGYDVHTEVSISFVQAILGGEVDVKTLEGEVEMKIPKGCQPDSKLLLRGKGIKELNGHRKGDHYVHIKVNIPKKISGKQEEILRAFEEEGKHPSGLAKAATSAFEKLFGKDKEENTKNDESSQNDSNTGSVNGVVEEKKTA